MTLSELIDNLKVGQVAIADFAINETWYVTRTIANQIRYCDEDGNTSDLVPLTYSNLRAMYTIIK